MTPPAAQQPTAPPCPACGRPLQAVALGADTAPWLCKDDARGWWQAELDAAALYDNTRRDFGRASHTVLLAVSDESGIAEVRGSSARPDTLPLLDDGVLDALAQRRGVAAGFVGQVRAEQKRRHP